MSDFSVSNSNLKATVKRFYGATAVVQLEDGSECSAETNRRNKSLVCGDEVFLEDRNGSYLIVEASARRSEFSRTDGYGRKKVIAANVDQILLVIAPQPEPHLKAIDRYWVAARNSEIPMCLVANKSDQPSSPLMHDFENLYGELGLPLYFVSAKTKDGLSSLKEVLSGKVSVLVGQSGVGKSSLVNSLCQEADTKVAELSEKRSEGRHTTTTTDFYDLGGGARILDSPGIREFGLDHYDQQSLELGFQEIAAVAVNCRFRDCVHLNTPGCAVQEASEQGRIDFRRLESYLDLLSKIDI